MTKYELSARVAQRLEVPISSIKMVIETTIDCIKETVHNNESVRIENFGSFYPRIKNYPKNNISGNSIPLPQRKIAVFKAAKRFKHIK